MLGFASLRGRVVRIRSVDWVSGWKTARVVVGMVIEDIIVMV